jgi:hypothetical protein
MVKFCPHVAYFLLKNCLFVPKLTYFLRSCAIWKFLPLLEKIDSNLRSCLEHLLNIRLNEIQWLQASLPISKGGLGIRKITDICLPAFLSSIYGAEYLLSNILPMKDNKIQIHLLEEALNTWSSINVDFPTYKCLQKEWDVINIKRIIETTIHFERATDLALFKALQLPESGAWLQAVPSKNIGTFIDGQILQIYVGLRLDCNLYQSHVCSCGNFVNETGIHGLSCSKSKGRFLRHSDLNNIIQRALSFAHIHSTLEPTGLSRDDGKRPDCVTLTPWSKGQQVIWDVTCVDTLATSYLPQTTIEAGSAAETACKKNMKNTKD